jgi:hypothetical protein
MTRNELHSGWYFASTFIMGLLLLFYVPNHKISGGLALGVMVVLVLKHVGLFIVFGAPLVGVLNVAKTRAKRLLRKYWPRRLAR